MFEVIKAIIIIRFEMRKANFHRKLTSPHDLATTTNQIHKLGIGGAEHHNLRESHAKKT